MLGDGYRDSPAQPVLRLRGLTRAFGGIVAVDGVDLDVVHGERHTIIGPNGAGKTTLFNVIAGEYLPTTGSVEVLGQDVSFLPLHLRTRMGLSRTFQTPSVFGGLTVAENLHLAALGVDRGHLSLRRINRDRDRLTLCRQIAEQVGVVNLLDEPVEDLAHGQKRQLDIGLALAAKPRILLLDEPAAGLAAFERTRLLELLLNLPSELTLMLIEHDMNIALQVADRVTMMHNGVVVAAGTPDEIRADQTLHDLYLGRGHALAEGSSA